MIQCNSYNEVRLDLINILSDIDNYPNNIKIIKDEKSNCFWIDYDEFTLEEIEGE